MRRNLLPGGAMVALLAYSISGCGGNATHATAAGEGALAACEPTTAMGQLTSEPAADGTTAAPMPTATAVPYTTGALKIPAGRPRLWWNADRLARAKQWFAANPFTPGATDYENLALHYLLTGNTASARKAIDWLMTFTFTTDSVASNPARWYGQAAILVYDWCHDQMTASERATILARWNGYVAALNAKSWGGVGMDGNNYYWGYLRNSLIWGIATYHENPMAESFVAHALKTRWGDSFVPYTQGPGVGGVPHEGSQYSRYTLSYAVLPFTTAAQMGYDVWNHTSYYREAIYGLIYSTTPGQTYKRGTTDARYEVFPFNDDETFKSGATAESFHFGNFVTTAIERWRGTPLAGHAQTWLDAIKPPVQHINASVFTPVAPRALSELPLDYFAAGNGMFYGRDRWGAQASMVNFQLGNATGVGHEHVDWGTFQIWRNGRWLSRETTGYTDKIAGYKNGTAVDCGKAVGHNGVLVGGDGPPTVFNRKGLPKVTRLESRPQYAFAAVDLSDAFRPARAAADQDNANAVRVVREMLFVRPLETTVVFDRIESAAAGVAKTFVLHGETQPAIEGANTATVVNGDQALRLTTLLPARPTYRVVTEGGTVGQFRLEADDAGPAQSYLLNVLQARGAADANVTASVTDTGTAFEVTLSHPTRGNARIVLQKGMTSEGGGFGFAASGAPAAAPLTSGVQKVRLSDAGPVWE